MDEADRLMWVVEHWDEMVRALYLGGPAILVLIAVLFKKWRVAIRALRVFAGANEGFEGMGIRRRVARQSKDEPLSVAGLIRNVTAESDPDPEKKPSMKESLKSLAPGIARQAAGALIGRLFRGRK